MFAPQQIRQWTVSLQGTDRSFYQPLMSKCPISTLKLKVTKLRSLDMYILVRKFHSCFIPPYSWSMHQMSLSIRKSRTVHPSSPKRFWTNWGEKKGKQIETKLSFLSLLEGVNLHMLGPDMRRFILCPPYWHTGYQSCQQGPAPQEKKMCFLQGPCS